MCLLVALGILAGALVVGSLLPTPARSPARVGLGFLVVLSPVLAAAVALASWDRATFATYLALLPLTFAWLAVIDMRFGISARLARFPSRGRRGNGDGNGTSRDA